MVRTRRYTSHTIRAKLESSDMSQVLEVADIFTGMDAISGLKRSPRAGLDKLVKLPALKGGGSPLRECFAAR